MHFAAFIEAGESMKDPGKFFHNNLVNSLNLIETAVETGVKRFVLSSTAAVYQSSDEPLTEESPLGADQRLRADKMDGGAGARLVSPDPRAALCRAALLQCLRRAARARRGAPARVAPDPARPGRGAWKAGSINVNGTDYPTPDGTCIRDYIHIADLVSAHLLALDALATRDRLVYNLGSGSGYSVREVIEMARVVTEHDIPVGRVADGARAIPRGWWPRPKKSAASWAGIPKHDNLREILASAWEWHRSHPNGYEE